MTFFDLARRNVVRHWLRSSLAVIGIVIGVIAIASLGIMGNSIGLMFNDMVSDVGDTVIVSPGDGRGRRQTHRAAGLRYRPGGRLERRHTVLEHR